MEPLISASCLLNFSMAAFTGFSMKCSSGYMPRYSCKEREAWGRPRIPPLKELETQLKVLQPTKTCACVCNIIAPVFRHGGGGGGYLSLLVLAESPDGPQVPAGTSAIREALNDQVHICEALLGGRGPSHGRRGVGDPGTPVVLHNGHKDAGCERVLVTALHSPDSCDYQLLYRFVPKKLVPFTHKWIRFLGCLSITHLSKVDRRMLGRSSEHNDGQILYQRLAWFQELWKFCAKTRSKKSNKSVCNIVAQCKWWRNAVCRGFTTVQQWHHRRLVASCLPPLKLFLCKRTQAFVATLKEEITQGAGDVYPPQWSKSCIPKLHTSLTKAWISSSSCSVSSLV